jgi:hypothetical protein
MRGVLRPAVVLWSSAILLGVTVVGLAIAIVCVLQHNAIPSDRIAAITAAFTAATFVLAALAALVALFAYQVAAQTPDLLPEIKFWFCPGNAVFLIKGPQDGAAGIPLLTQRQIPGQMLSFLVQFQAWVRVTNRRLWSARQPALRLRLRGLILPSNSTVERAGKWVVDQTDSLRSTIGLRWEGTAIHGGETRNLPGLELYELRATDDNPVITLEVFAEGFHKSFDFPIELITTDEYDARAPALPPPGGFY